MAEEPVLSPPERPERRGRDTQRCPNCDLLNDVSFFVGGQLVRCQFCSVRFAIRRSGPPPPRRTPLPRPSAEASLPVEASASTDDAWAANEAAPMEPPPPVQPVLAPMPSILGYELKERIGQGGMGEVYRAVRVSDGRPVAIKVLGASLAVVPDYVRRFDREAAAMAQLDHPGIVRLLSRGRSGPHCWIAMELIEGLSLRSYVHGEKPSPRTLARLLAQVAHGLACAHARGVVHRDLKPDNVLVTPQGRTKILDFGLAGLDVAVVAGAEVLTQSNVSMGTANYMAPEQRRDAKHVDHRADLYSFGAMAYELLTGELPIGRFPPPSRAQPGLDRAWDVLVERCLDVDPARRPHSALELAHALDALAGVAPRLQLAPRTRRGALRSGIFSWLGLGAGISAVLGLVALQVVHDHERRLGRYALAGPAEAAANGSSARPFHRLYRR